MPNSIDFITKWSFLVFEPQAFSFITTLSGNGTTFLIILITTFLISKSKHFRERYRSPEGPGAMHPWVLGFWLLVTFASVVACTSNPKITLHFPSRPILLCVTISLGEKFNDKLYFLGNSLSHSVIKYTRWIPICLCRYLMPHSKSAAVLHGVLSL